ncbi:dipeptide ABC transporter ATP-binding protein [Microbacterium trichothecenolyticum]|uniref:Glutathione import ATP-binding protein GsiA n=1 Tax=Microbacterium trichothecenolyticum TaxID=69370 RepID=A0A0M2H5E5_MICTR|nr:ABC transporter ATP-binding protein [Microbacterium trichothecenolyticum]KJL41551.1 Glutathione import ATP-binding protein GsiA [Microbacterium trichothecenolyticum]
MSVPETVVDPVATAATAAPANALLDIRDLALDLRDGTRLLHGISLSVAAGETVGLVGESGSGKSLTARTVLGLVPDRSTITGEVVLDGAGVLTAPAAGLRQLRRHGAAMIFQDPRAGINPMRTIGDHLTEALRLAEGWSTDAARARAVELLEAVRLPRPEDHLRQYPHEFSGGMLQRVMIAGALTTSPKLLVCDEPTTALDVTTQAEIIGVLAEQRASRGMGMLFITHDLNLAASLCDRVYVMSGGQVVEHGRAHEVLRDPRAEYTRRLVAATPTLVGAAAQHSIGGSARHAGPQHPFAAASSAISDSVHGEMVADAVDPAAAAPPMLEADGVSKTYVRRGKEPVRAVIDASVAVPRGGALGVVGESGSGKSTLARMIVGLEAADAGDIRIDGRQRSAVPRNRRDRLAHARSVQMVFQDPYLSLDPRITAGRAIEDALRLHTRLGVTEARSRVLDLLAQVGLGEKHAGARPRTLSGGQRQRVAIARALAIEPDVLVMDEATSALDVSVQAQVLDLVDRIRRERGLTVLFISHDLAVVRRVCDETVVMRRGEIVERGLTAELLAAPQHEYTRLLIDSVPKPGWDAEAAGAEVEAAAIDGGGSDTHADDGDAQARAVETANIEAGGQAR